MTDASGNVTLARNFEPFGTTLSTSSNGASDTVSQYTGATRDATGLTYVCARYLDSITGTFTSKDSFRTYSDPQSLNGWNYTGSDPINRADPSGKCYWPFEDLRKLEPVQCNRLDMARQVYYSSRTSIAEKTLAATWIAAWAAAHAPILALAIGTSPIWGSIALLTGCTTAPATVIVTPQYTAIPFDTASSATDNWIKAFKNMRTVDFGVINWDGVPAIGQAKTTNDLVPLLAEWTLVIDKTDPLRLTYIDYNTKSIHFARHYQYGPIEFVLPALAHELTHALLQTESAYYANEVDNERVAYWVQTLVWQAVRPTTQGDLAPEYYTSSPNYHNNDYDTPEILNSYISGDYLNYVDESQIENKNLDQQRQYIKGLTRLP